MRSVKKVLLWLGKYTHWYMRVVFIFVIGYNIALIVQHWKTFSDLEWARVNTAAWCFIAWTYFEMYQVSERFNGELIDHLHQAGELLEKLLKEHVISQLTNRLGNPTLEVEHKTKTVN